MVDMLGMRGDGTLGLDELAKGGDSGFGENIKCNQVVLLPLLGVEYVQGDAPVGRRCQGAIVSLESSALTL